jgi:hypothetical protein
MEHKEIIRDSKIERILMAFKDAVECVPRGVCRPDEAHIAVSKYYVAFIHEGEIRLMREGKFLLVEVKADNSRLITDGWDMFVLRNGGQIISSPRLAVGREIFTDEFVEYIRKGFQALLSAASWV